MQKDEQGNKYFALIVNENDAVVIRNHHRSCIGFVVCMVLLLFTCLAFLVTRAVSFYQLSVNATEPEIKDLDPLHDYRVMIFFACFSLLPILGLIGVLITTIKNHTNWRSRIGTSYLIGKEHPTYKREKQKYKITIKSNMRNKRRLTV